MQAQHSKIKETETTVNEIRDLLQSFCAIQLEPVILPQACHQNRDTAHRQIWSGQSAWASVDHRSSCDEQQFHSYNHAGETCP
jgi:hypothetical protein